MKKRILSIFLAAILIVTLIPTSVLAQAGKKTATFYDDNNVVNGGIKIVYGEEYGIFPADCCVDDELLNPQPDTVITFYEANGDGWTELSEKPSDAGDYKVNIAIVSDEYECSKDYPYTIQMAEYAEPEIEEALEIDYVNETFIPNDGYNVSEDEDFTTLITEETKIHFGKVYYIQIPGDDNHIESDTAEYYAERPEAPEWETFDIHMETVKGRKDMYIKGVTEEYEFANVKYLETAGWQQVDPEFSGSSLILTEYQQLLVRKKSTATSFASEYQLYKFLQSSQLITVKMGEKEQKVDCNTPLENITPTKENYKFDGWYCDSELQNPWNFEDVFDDAKLNALKDQLNNLTDDYVVTLYPKWVSDSTSTSYPIWIGYSDQYNPGVQVKAGDVLGDGTVIYTPDADNPGTKGTLTLNNAKLFTGENDGVGAGIAVGVGDHPFTELTINLVGNSQIGKTVAQFPEELQEGDYSVGYGILAYSSVTFTGEGTLTIYDQNVGILASGLENLPAVNFGTETQPFTGEVTITSYTPNDSNGAIKTNGSVAINGGTVNLASKVGCGIIAPEAGDVTINGGKLNVECGYFGIASPAVTISDGEVDIKAELIGIGYDSKSNVTINGGSVSVTSGVYGIYATDVIISGDNAVVTVDAQSVGIFGTNLTISGDNTMVTVDAQTYGIRTGGNVTINGGTVNVISDGDYSDGINAGGNVTISDGEVTVTANGAGMYLQGDVTISGGTVNVTGYMGIDTEEDNVDVTISGGKVSVTADCIGIHSTGNVTISGGEVSVTSLEQDGIYVDASAGTVLISGGKVSVTSVTDGIYAPNVIISGDSTEVIVDTQVYGIVGTDVTISGDNTALTVYSQGFGIYTENGVTIDGNNMAVTVDAQGYGIFTYGDITISGVDVGVTSDSMGICSTANVTVSGDNTAVTVDAQSYGIFVYGSVSIDGSTVKAKCVPGDESAAILAHIALVIDTDDMEILNANESYTAETLALTAKDGGYVTIQPKQTTPPTPAVVIRPTVTVPVSGEEGSIEVKATVSGNTATVQPIKEEDIQEIIGDDAEAGMLTIDLSGTNKTITAVKLPTENVQAIAEAAAESGKDTAGLKLEFSSGALEFDAKALETIAAAAGDAEKIEIHFDEVGTARLNNAQKDAVSEMYVLEGFEAYVTVNGQRVSDFEGGNVVVYIPYEVPEDKNPAAYTVWYVADDGTLEKMDATYDGENHRFVVTHFSDYVLTYDETVGQFGNCPKDATCPMSKFTDANANAWYHDGVHYCLDNGIMVGFPGDLFKPDGTTTRAQIAQILYNLEGQPAFMNDNVFTDVVSGSWYEKAVVWAQGKGVVSGYPDGTFKPDDPITREQLAVILYNYAQYKGIDVSVDENTNFLSFNDFWDVSEWAKPAMMWAIDRELIVGSNWDLKPQGDAVRAQAATIIWKFCETVVK